MHLHKQQGKGLNENEEQDITIVFIHSVYMSNLP